MRTDYLERPFSPYKTPSGGPAIMSFLSCARVSLKDTSSFALPKTTSWRTPRGERRQSAFGGLTPNAVPTKSGTPSAPRLRALWLWPPVGLKSPLDLFLPDLLTQTGVQIVPIGIGNADEGFEGKCLTCFFLKI